jgi:protein-disulfide isomerase
MSVQYPKAKPKTRRPPGGRQPLSERLPSKRVLLVGAAAAAALIAGILIGVSVTSSSGGKSTSGVATQSILSGIPQQVEALGRPNAPVTLVQFGDLQCPACQYFDLNTIPELIRKYVRPGKLRIVFKPITFIGPDSAVGVQSTLAAGLQNRFWNLSQLLYANQGTENSGWLNDKTVRKLAGEIPGLDVSRFERDLDSARVAALAKSADQEAQEIGLNQTPTFQLGRTNGELSALDVSSLNPSAFEPSIDRLLAG